MIKVVLRPISMSVVVSLSMAASIIPSLGMEVCDLPSIKKNNNIVGLNTLQLNPVCLPSRHTLMRNINKFDSEGNLPAFVIPKSEKSVSQIIGEIKNNSLIFFLNQKIMINDILFGKFNRIFDTNKAINSRFNSVFDGFIGVDKKYSLNEVLSKIDEIFDEKIFKDKNELLGLASCFRHLPSNDTYLGAKNHPLGDILCEHILLKLIEKLGEPKYGNHDHLSRACYSLSQVYSHAIEMYEKKNLKLTLKLMHRPYASFEGRKEIFRTVIENFLEELKERSDYKDGSEIKQIVNLIENNEYVKYIDCVSADVLEEVNGANLDKFEDLMSLLEGDVKSFFARDKIQGDLINSYKKIKSELKDLKKIINIFEHPYVQLPIVTVGNESYNVKLFAQEQFQKQKLELLVNSLNFDKSNISSWCRLIEYMLYDNNVKDLEGNELSSYQIKYLSAKWHSGNENLSTRKKVYIENIFNHNKISLERKTQKLNLREEGEISSGDEGSSMEVENKIEVKNKSTHMHNENHQNRKISKYEPQFKKQRTEY